MANRTSKDTQISIDETAFSEVTVQKTVFRLFTCPSLRSYFKNGEGSEIHLAFETAHF